MSLTLAGVLAGALHLHGRLADDPIFHRSAKHLRQHPVSVGPSGRRVDGEPSYPLPDHRGSHGAHRCGAEGGLDPLLEVHLVVVARAVPDLERPDPLIGELADRRAVVAAAPRAALDGGTLHREPGIGVHLRRERLRGGTTRPCRVQVARLVPPAGKLPHRPEGATSATSCTCHLRPPSRATTVR